jgi:hypothetical protein
MEVGANGWEYRHPAFYNDNRVLADITDWILNAPPNQWTEWAKRWPKVRES